MAMHIRPAPVHRVRGDGGPGPGLAMWLPIVALLVVVTAAWAGASLKAQPAPMSTTPGGGDGAPLSAPGVAPALFPSRALDLQVMSGPEILAARAAGIVQRDLVAVSGVLRSEPLPLSCPAVHLTISRTFCHRLAALFPVAASPDPSDGAVAPAADPSGPQVAGHILSGTDVPPILAVETEIGPWLAQSVPIILLGRYEDPRAKACEPGRQWCRDDLVVEKIVWAHGAWWGPSIVRDPGVSEGGSPVDVARLRAITERAAARHELIIASAIMRRDLLEVVDPLAARSTANGRSTAVWYIRSIASPEPGRRPQMVWTVIEDATGTVLGHSWPAP